MYFFFVRRFMMLLNVFHWLTEYCRITKDTWFFFFFFWQILLLTAYQFTEPLNQLLLSGKNLETYFASQNEAPQSRWWCGRGVKPPLGPRTHSGPRSCWMLKLLNQTGETNLLPWSYWSYNKREICKRKESGEE